VQRTRLTVDALDMRIVREIVSGGKHYFRGDRAALDDVARRLGVHRNTVSDRVTRMETNGFLFPLTLEVDPSAVGLVAVIAALDIPPERRTEETKTALLAVEGVWGILTYLDAWLLLLHAVDEATVERQIAAACAASAGRLLEIESNSARDWPDACPVEISSLDVRIIAALMQDARAPFRSLAAELGVTARTVERRYARLEREGVITLFPTGERTK
jgi:DNA-binding Lrp family transcriptional regulator